MRIRVGVFGAALFAIVASASGVSAEVRRVEAVGIYGIEESARRRVIPKDEAIEQATWEGVSRVALELIGERAPAGAEGEAGFEGDDPVGLEGEDDAILSPIDGPGGAEPARSPSETDGDETALLESALGQDMLPYTRSYRILEDRGEKPVLFNEDPEIETEYVVVVEVFVDVDRVAKALERSGLITRAASSDPNALLTLEVVGLDRYAGLAHLVDLLRDSLGATRVQTLEFSRERQVLALEGRFGLEELAGRLADSSDASIVLEPLAVDPTRARIRVRARYAPPVEDDELEESPALGGGRG